MALFSPTDPKPETISKPIVIGKNYRHSLTDSEFKNQYSFYHNVAGTPVNGTYYRGFLGEDEEPLGFQPTNYAVYQSYTRVDRMVVKVDGDPGFMYNAQMAEATETFQAFVFFDLVPIIGDLFIKDLGDGKTGLWQILNAPELRNYSAIKVWQCEFKLLGYVDQAIEDNLNSKTVERYIYSADSLLHGGNAIITHKQAEQSRDLGESVFYLAQHMLENFYWPVESTIALPGDDTYGRIYDPALTTFIKDVIPSGMYAGRSPIALPSYKTGLNNDAEQRLTVWDAFRQGNFRMLPLVNKAFYKYPRRNFFSTRNYLGFESTRFESIIVPGLIEYNTLHEPGMINPTGFGYMPQTPAPTPYTYYFSNEFYELKPTDPWELFLVDFFVNKNINREQLLRYYDEYPTWSPKDQLYRGGLLIAMMTIARKVNRGW